MSTPIGTRALRVLLAVALTCVGAVALAVPARATNSYTQPGNRTQACAVDWYAKTDLSSSYTKDYDGNGTIDVGEVYSNQGYLYAVSSTNTYPTVHGPGAFDIQHFFVGTSMGFRIPIATDYTMYGVKVVVNMASDSPQTFQINDTSFSTMGLAAYQRFDGDPKYTVEAPTPKVTISGTEITLEWAVLPAGSANIYGFSATATSFADPTTRADDPANHYIIQAELTGRYAEGAGCEPTVPPLPTPPTEQRCQQVLAGRSLFPVPAGDLTARDKYGDGGETNADGWVTSTTTRGIRLYGATDNDLTNVTFTAVAAQGFTFVAPVAPATITVVTGSPSGMGQLYSNGYTATATGIGDVVVSPDGKTVTLTIANMPAKSAFAFGITAQLDGSLKQLVIDETMVGTLTNCSIPTKSATPTKTRTTVKPTEHETRPEETRHDEPGPGETTTTAPAAPARGTLAATGSDVSLVGVGIAGVVLASGVGLILVTQKRRRTRG